MIHDLIPINFPEFSIPKEYKRHSKRITNTLRYSENIITNSKYTKEALLKFSIIKKLENTLINQKSRYFFLDKKSSVF